MFRLIRRSLAGVSPFESVKELLRQSYTPAYLHIDGGKEDDGLHCRITIVSNKFEGKTPVQRHRDVMELFKKNFEEGLHALSIRAKTPGEWETEQKREQRS